MMAVRVVTIDFCSGDVTKLSLILVVIVPPDAWPLFGGDSGSDGADDGSEGCGDGGVENDGNGGDLNTLVFHIGIVTRCLYTGGAKVFLAQDPVTQLHSVYRWCTVCTPVCTPVCTHWCIHWCTTGRVCTLYRNPLYSVFSVYRHVQYVQSNVTTWMASGGSQGRD